MPIEVNEIFIAPDIEELMENYDALHDFPTVQTDKAELSPENVSPTDIPHLEQNLMFLPEFSPVQVTKLQKNDTYCTNILQHIECSKDDIFFIDGMGIPYKKVIDFNSTISALVVPQILIKYFLQVPHDSLGHIVARKP